MSCGHGLGVAAGGGLNMTSYCGLIMIPQWITRDSTRTVAT